MIESKMRSPLMFNIDGDDRPENRAIWFGNSTNLMNLNNCRYDWAIDLYRQMRDNFWVPQKINITQDVTDYTQLTASDRRGFDGILSYLTFLDSIQVCNIPNLKGMVSAPEITLCMAEQISQEAMHSASYQYIIETVIPSDRRQEIYDFWRTDKILKERCQYIANFYQQYVDSPTEQNYFISLTANYLLESLYFYQGFIFYYNLASRHLMSGCADVFKMINRDELSHVRLYQKLIKEAIAIFPYCEDEIYSMFDNAVNHEKTWSNHIIGDQVLGITSDSIDQYTKYLANIRLKAIGLRPLYEGSKYKKSPYSHLEKSSDTQGNGHSKANFFESTVTSYVMSSGLTGWDNI